VSRHVCVPEYVRSGRDRRVIDGRVRVGVRAADRRRPRVVSASKMDQGRQTCRRKRPLPLQQAQAEPASGAASGDVPKSKELV
jgi:hypothetical protein